MKNARAVLVAMAVVQLSPAVHSRTFDFAEGKWDRGEFFEARNDDWDRGDPIVQMPDCTFELTGTNGVWRPARVLNFLKGKSMSDGSITNNVVVLSAPGVDEPAAVRYAWRQPWTGSLYNEVDLPLGTFERRIK